MGSTKISKSVYVIHNFQWIMWMTSVTLRHSLIIYSLWLHNFVKMIKNTTKLCRRFFPHKSNMQMIEMGWNVLCICSMTALTSNSKLCRFMTPQKVIKTPENFAQGSFSVKLTKICHKNKREGLASSSL